MKCYMVDWYTLDTKCMKVIMMMIMRSQRAAQIRVPFFDVALPIFNKVNLLLIDLALGGELKFITIRVLFFQRLLLRLHHMLHF